MNHSEILQHLKEAGYDEKRLNFVLQAVAAYEETPTQESANYLAEHLVEFGTVEQCSPLSKTGGMTQSDL